MPSVEWEVGSLDSDWLPECGIVHECLHNAFITQTLRTLGQCSECAGQLTVARRIGDLRAISSADDLTIQSKALVAFHR